MTRATSSEGALTRTLRAVRRWTEIVSRWVASFLLLAMILVVLLGVGGRVLLGRSIIEGHAEITGYLLAAFTAFGLSASFASGSFVRVEYGYAKLPPPVRKGALWFFTMLLLAVAAILSYVGYLLVVQSYEYGTKSPGATRIATWIPEVAFIMGMILFLAHLVATVAARPSAVPLEPEHDPFQVSP